MDRFIKFFQAVGVTALVVSVSVGYGTVQRASAQCPWPWCDCDANEYCHSDLTKGQKYMGFPPCMVTECLTTEEICCLPRVSN